MTEVPNITLALYALTDVGMVRSGNEDNFLILDLSTAHSWFAHEDENHQLLTYNQGYYGALLAVSDGMGGALAGEVASRMAVETVRDRMLQLQAHEFYGKLPFQERLRLAIEEANFLINEESTTNMAHRGLGATFTAVATLGDRVYFGQVGDSRAYLLRSGRIAQITKDQSLVQQLIDAGQISEEEAETHQYRNVILQALGAHTTVNVEVSSLALRQYDTLLLCSDGLSGKMRSEEIAQIVHSAPDLKSACSELIALANERGGEDNITVIIVQFSGATLPPPADKEPISPDLYVRASDTPTRIQFDDDDEKTRPLNQLSTAPPPHRNTQPISRLADVSPPDETKGQASGNRRRPITSVFGREELEDNAESLAEPPPDTAPAAENEQQRAASPLVVASAAVAGIAVTAPETIPDPALPAQPARGGVINDSPEFRRPQDDTPNGFKLTPLKFVLGVLFIGILAAGLIFARTYFGKTKEAFEKTPAGLEVKRDKLKTDINVRRGSLEHFRTLLSQSADPRKTNSQQTLEEVSEELNKADALLTGNKLPEVSTTLEKVDNLLRMLDEEIKRLSTLRPSRLALPTPVQS